MKIRLLGTGYGECKTRKRNSMDFRRSGGALVDEKILIDAPIDIFDVADELGFADMFSEVTDVVISHSHPSHFSVEALLRLSERRKIRVYATDVVLKLIPDTDKIEKIKLYVSFPAVIDGKYTLYSLPANHSTEISGEVCMNFVISSDKALLYALDGGGIGYRAWSILSSLKINTCILDCALADSDATYALTYHNNLDSARLTKDILIGSGICEPNAKFVLSHIPTDKKRSIHCELTEKATEVGMTVAYDGYFWSV